MKRAAFEAVGDRHRGAAEAGCDVFERGKGQLAGAGRAVTGHAVGVIKLTTIAAIRAAGFGRIGIAPEPAVERRGLLLDDQRPAARRADHAAVIGIHLFEDHRAIGNAASGPSGLEPRVHRGCVIVEHVAVHRRSTGRRGAAHAHRFVVRPPEQLRAACPDEGGDVGHLVRSQRQRAGGRQGCSGVRRKRRNFLRWRSAGRTQCGAE